MTGDDALLTLADRPDPRRLSMLLYPMRFPVRLRLDDLDFNGHVNNVAVTVLHQESRATMLQHVWPIRDRDRRPQFAVAQHVTHFLAELFYPGDVQCCAGVGRVGTSSIRIATALFDGDRCVSLGDTVLVMRRDGVPAAVGQAERAALAAVRLGAPAVHPAAPEPTRG